MATEGEDKLRQFQIELAAAGLDLDEADRERVYPLWLDNLPRRGWLRQEAFAPDELPIGEHALPPQGASRSPGPRADAAIATGAGSELCDLDLAQVCALLEQRRISSREITQAYLERIDRFDAVLGTTAHLLTERALIAADASDARRASRSALSALDGAPIGLKDCIGLAGSPMEGGSQAYAGNMSSRSAGAAVGLEAAGAVIVAKHRMHELGAGPAVATGPNRTGRNPYDLARIPGGSSSGSAAAVAAGLCAGALGTDAAGSVRIPAAFCGLVGLKPTRGAIPLDGCLPLTFSLDTIGTLTRDVAGAALLFSAAAQTQGEPTGAARGDLRGVRLGVLRRYYADAPDVGEAMRAAFDEACRALVSLGAALIDVDIPSIDRNEVAYTTLLAESFTIHGEAARAAGSKLTNWFRSQVLTAALFSADDLTRVRRFQGRLLRESLDALSGVDALLHPGMSDTAPAFGNIFITALTQPRSRFTRPWNVTGLPALALPCGVSLDGLPLSLQLVGRPHEEFRLLQIAQSYEREAAWHKLRPDPARWTGNSVTSQAEG